MTKPYDYADDTDDNDHNNDNYTAGASPLVLALGLGSLVWAPWSGLPGPGFLVLAPWSRLLGLSGRLKKKTG